MRICFTFWFFNGSTPPGMAIITDHRSDVTVLSIHKCEEYGKKIKIFSFCSTPSCEKFTFKTVHVNWAHLQK